MLNTKLNFFSVFLFYTQSLHVYVFCLFAFLFANFRQSFCGRCQAEYLFGDQWLKCPKSTTGFSGTKTWPHIVFWCVLNLSVLKKHTQKKKKKKKNTQKTRCILVRQVSPQNIFFSDGSVLSKHLFCGLTCRTSCSHMTGWYRFTIFLCQRNIGIWHINNIGIRRKHIIMSLLDMFCYPASYFVL